MRTPLPFTALACALLATLSPADEVRLKDGRILVGKTTVRGDRVVVETRTGVETLAKADVERIRSDDELRAELQRLETKFGDSSHAAIELCRTAQRFGLRDEMWERIDALVKDGDWSEDNRLVRYLGSLESELLTPAKLGLSPKSRVNELIYQVRRRTSPGRKAAIEAVLANVQDEAAQKQVRVRARKSNSAEQRAAAARAVALAGDPKFLWRTAVIDRAAATREDAIQSAVQRSQDEGAVDYLAAGLNAAPEIRIRTAQALANLKDLDAAKYLVAAGPAAAAAAGNDGSIRAHIAVINQESYVRDFDVEVAMSSFIADPKIDVLQYGSVLDLNIQAVTAHRRPIVNAYRSALRSLVGSDPGKDPRRWADWFAKTNEQMGGQLGSLDLDPTGDRSGPSTIGGRPDPGLRGNPLRRGGVLFPPNGIPIAGSDCVGGPTIPQGAPAGINTGVPRIAPVPRSTNKRAPQVTQPSRPAPVPVARPVPRPAPVPRAVRRR